MVERVPSGEAVDRARAIAPGPTGAERCGSCRQERARGDMVTGRGRHIALVIVIEGTAGRNRPASLVLDLPFVAIYHYRGSGVRAAL